jgi:hypothetical protein
MAVFKVKLQVLQGSTFRKLWTLKSGSPAVVTDLSDYKARMQIRSELESPTVLAELTTENGGITLGGPLGTIALFLSDTTTAAFLWDSAVYDLELIAPGIGGDVTRRIEGSVSVSKEVTR